MPEREPLKFRIKLVAIGFLFFGLAMFAWAALLVLGLSMEETREKLLEGAPVHLVAPGVAFLAMCALSTAIGLLRRAEWSRPVSTLLCLSSLLFFPVGTAFGLFGIWALSTTLPSSNELSAIDS